MDIDNIDMYDQVNENGYDVYFQPSNALPFLIYNNEEVFNNKEKEIEDAFLLIDILNSEEEEKPVNNITSNNKITTINKKQEIMKKLQQSLLKIDNTIGFIKSFTEESIFQNKAITENLVKAEDSIKKRKINFFKKRDCLSKAFLNYDAGIQKIKSKIKNNKKVFRIVEIFNSMGFILIGNLNIDVLEFTHDSFNDNSITIQVKLHLSNDIEEDTNYDYNISSIEEINFSYYDNLVKNKKELNIEGIVTLIASNRSIVINLTKYFESLLLKIFEIKYHSLITVSLNVSIVKNLLNKLLIVNTSLLFKRIMNDVTLIKNTFKESYYFFNSICYNFHNNRDQIHLSFQIESFYSFSLMISYSENKTITENQTEIIDKILFNYKNSLYCNLNSYLFCIMRSYFSIKYNVLSDRIVTQISTNLKNNIKNKLVESICITKYLHRLTVNISKFTSYYLMKYKFCYFDNSNLVIDVIRKVNFNNNYLEIVNFVKIYSLLNKFKQETIRLDFSLNFLSNNFISIDSKYSKEVLIYSFEKESTNENRINIADLYQLERILSSVKKEMISNFKLK